MPPQARTACPPSLHDNAVSMPSLVRTASPLPLPDCTVSTPPLIRMVSLMLPPAKLDQPSPLLQVQLPPLPVQVLPLPIQVLPPQYETASAVKDGSVRTLFWDAVARVQEGDFGAEFEQFNSSDFHIFSFDLIRLIFISSPLIFYSLIYMSIT
jgi:hypothetical protein